MAFQLASCKVGVTSMAFLAKAHHAAKRANDFLVGAALALGGLPPTSLTNVWPRAEVWGDDCTSWFPCNAVG